MPIDYATWVSRMTNSIVDESTVRKTDAFVPVKLTPLQIRSQFASLLVPHIRNSEDAMNWLNALCTEIILGDVQIGRVTAVLGYHKAREYYDLPDHHEVVWTLGLRAEIAAGLVI